MARADLFSGSLVVWHIRGGAAHFYPASPEPPLSGGEAILLSGTQNPNSENWRCVFENIRTDFINGLGGRNSPKPPFRPPRLEPERKGRFQVFLWRQILLQPDFY